MHRICLLFLLSPYILLTTSVCQSPESQSVAKEPEQVALLVSPDSTWWASSGIHLQPIEHRYSEAKSFVDQERRALSAAFQKGDIALDSVRKAFTQHLLNRIIPHWYGTPWSFSGHTAVPRQGKIACGYFVSTTLQDVGLRLNRYRLAQQSPSDEAAILSMGDTVRVFQHAVPDSAVIALKSRLQEGLHFVGLGSAHVGYLLKWHGELLFLHSNYAMPMEVVIQPVAQSVLMGFNQFYITPITHNDRMLRSWLSSSEVPTQNTAGAIFVNW